jgi:glycosyltransferase involved in cell wall biosynthesis
MREPIRVQVVCDAHIPSVVLAALHPLSFLSEDGFCEHRYALTTEITSADLEWCQVLFMLRGTSPSSLRLARTARQHGRAFVSLWDDNPFDVPSDNASHSSFTAARASIVAISRLADIAVCNTRVNADVFSARTQRAVQSLDALPPMIDPAPRSVGPVGGDPVLGFGGGIDHRGVIERLILPALESLAEQNRRFAFEIVGVRPEVPAALRDRVRFHPHISDYWEWLAFRNRLQWQFALAPLEDTLFNRCKTPNKFVEFASVSIPCIFSQIPPFTGVVETERTGFLVENRPEAWCAAIGRLLAQPGLCSRVGAAAQERARGMFGRDVIAPRYRALLEGALAAARSRQASAPSPRQSVVGQRGLVVVVAGSLSACVWLYFRDLPGLLDEHLPIVGPDELTPALLGRARAVVFVRGLRDFEEALARALAAGVPSYYFCDDNFPLLMEEGVHLGEDLSAGTLRQKLARFAGVLLSTQALLRYFTLEDIHPRLFYYPPVQRRDRLGPPDDPQRPLRIAFFGGVWRGEAMERLVLPAIERLSKDVALELVWPADGRSRLPETRVPLIPFARDGVYIKALGLLSVLRPHVLVHPSPATRNNPFKTQHCLINAAAVGAVPVLSSTEPFTDLLASDVALLCGNSVDLWHDALRELVSAERRAEIWGALVRYCDREFSGAENARVLDQLLRPLPGGRSSVAHALTVERGAAETERSRRWQRPGVVRP